MPDVPFASAEPAGGCDFSARVKIDGFSSLEVQVAKERVVPPAERKVGQWGGYADVDTDGSLLCVHSP